MSVDFGSLEASVARRASAAQARGRTRVYRVGEPSFEIPLIEERELEFRKARSGRTLLAPGDETRVYRVGGGRRTFVRTADIVNDDGKFETTLSPRPGCEIVNGLSDRVR